MAFLSFPRALSQLLSLFLLLHLFTAIARADECQPSTWALAARHAAPTARAVASKGASVALVGSDNGTAPGQVNCRYWTTTGADVNYYTCTQLADKYEIAVETFFALNPDVDAQCGNIQPNTQYCVDGCKYFLCSFLVEWALWD